MLITRTLFLKLMVSMSATLFMMSVCMGWITFPISVIQEIEKNALLTPGTTKRNAWESQSFPLDFSIHVFNVTNPIDVQNGGKPIVQDVGPFVFCELKNKSDIQDDEENDSVSFNIENTLYFSPTKSNGLTGEELVTMPHPLIQIIAAYAKGPSAEKVETITEGLNVVFSNESAFITAPMMELFFRGYFVDCSHKCLPAMEVCRILDSGQIKGTKKFNETHYTFALMEQSFQKKLNGTLRLTVLRGQQNINDVGTLIEVNGEDEMNYNWSKYECSQLKGTDGTIFPPFIHSNDKLWWYSHELCRPMGLTFSKHDHYDGIPVGNFKMNIRDIEYEGSCRCFCGWCPKNYPAKGTLDISMCIGTPMIASMPHFLDGEKSLFANIEGLQPNHSKHQTHVTLEMITGTPIRSSNRVQFNLIMEPVDKVASMKNLKMLTMPLFWIDESVLPNPVVLKKLVFLYCLRKMIKILRWFTLVTSFTGFAYAAYFYIQRSPPRRIRRRHILEISIKPAN